MKIEKVNIGEIIRLEVSRQKMSKASFARKIGIKPQNVVLTIFNKNSIDTNKLVEISEVLKHNFFQYYKSDEDHNNIYYGQGGIKEIKASVKLQYGDDVDEKQFSFIFKDENKILNK